MSQTQPMPVHILSWRPVVKGSLRGFCVVQIGQLKINDVSVWTKDDRSWASMPSKPMIGRDGPIMDNKTGKPRYSAICEWANKDSGERFSESVIAAIERIQPGCLA